MYSMGTDHDFGAGSTDDLENVPLKTLDDRSSRDLFRDQWYSPDQDSPDSIPDAGDAARQGKKGMYQQQTNNTRVTSNNGRDVKIQNVS